MTASEERRVHWERVWASKTDEEVSWYEPSPERSLRWIHACGLGPEAAVIDVGGGTARLAEALSREGFRDLTVLDVSGTALERARARWSDEAAVVWLEADVTRWTPPRSWDLWHDRAVFHFLVDPEDRAAYARAGAAGVAPGGWLVIATFALGGPERCSGLEVQRHDAASIGRVLGAAFALVDDEVVEHTTPSGARQRFQWARFRRRRAGEGGGGA